MLMTVPNSFTSFWDQMLVYDLGDVQDLVLDDLGCVSDPQLLREGGLQLQDAPHLLNL